MKIGDVSLTSFTQGAGAELRANVNKALQGGARALILDLRENGGGLLDEAVNVASIFIPDGTIVSTDGRSQPRQVYTAKGKAISAGIPMVVLVDRGTASAAEIVTGALQDRGRGIVVGTHTYGKGVFQEIEPLPNGGALDITVGEYFTPERSQPRRRRGPPGRRDQAERLCDRQPAHVSGRGASGGRADGRRQAPVSARAEASAGAPRVAVLERRGKFLVAEPLFGPGPRLVVSRDRRADVGDLVVLRAAADRRGRGGGRATVARRIGRPEVARDVIEALMVDRGLRRAFDPAVEHEARSASEVSAEVSGRRDLRDLPTFTIDPASARDFDDAISAEALSDSSWRVWVHIADVSAYVAPRSLVDREAYRRGTSVYVPGAVEPMLPPALSNNACSLVPGQDRLAVTVEMVITGERVTQAAFHRSVIRSDERLDYDRVDRVFAGAEAAAAPWAEPLAAARAAAGALAARRAASSAIVVDSAEPEFGSTAPATWSRSRPWRRPSRTG